MSKKPFLLTVISLTIFNLAASAQTAFRYNMKYRYGKEIVVESKDSTDFVRLIFPRDNTDNLFLVNDFYKTGKPKMAGKSLTSDPYLVLQGVNVQFFPNGQKKSERNFDKGKFIGDFLLNYPNGKTYLAGTYDPDSKLIINECLDSTGKTLASGGNGHVVRYTDDFTKILEEGDIVNGRENGEWNGSVGDSISFTSWYDKGVLTKGISRLNGKEYTFTKVDVEPSFNGNMQALYKFIGSHLHYPAEAKEHNIQGKVFLSFVIEKDGTLTNIEVLRGIGSGCDEESVRVLKLSPKWSSGQRYGIPARIQFFMPVSFTLVTEDIYIH